MAWLGVGERASSFHFCMAALSGRHLIEDANCLADDADRGLQLLERDVRHRQWTSRPASLARLRHYLEALVTEDDPNDAADDEAAVAPAWLRECLACRTSDARQAARTCHPQGADITAHEQAIWTSTASSAAHSTARASTLDPLSRRLD
jgi:hypothetical protein